MASVSSTSSSSSSSIYGTRNVISGLASGMDTEGMIENAISAYKTKISGLSKQRTKLGWQQEAYRDIIGKMAAFSTKYTSYTSSTNLMSTSFFNQAVRTVANGANASKVAASGRGTSDVSINAVKQLATAATYKLSGSALMGGTDSKYASAAASGSFDLDKMTVSSFNGTMSLNYGKDQTLSFTFSEGDVFESIEDLAANMQKQLEGQTISLTSGGGKKASEMLTVEVDKVNNTISFKDKANNKVYISSVSDSMKKAFGVETGEGNKSFRVGELTKEVDAVDYLEANPMSITLDGVTKTIKMPTKEDIITQLKEQAKAESEKPSGDRDKVQAISDLIEKISKGEELTDEEKNMRSGAYMEALQGGIDKAFGTLANGESKLQVVNNSNESGKLQLEFKAGQEGSSFAVTSSVGKSMGFGGTQLTSYLSTSKTLKDLLGEEGLKGLESGTDKDGNTTYAFEINGVKIGDFTEKTELSTIMSRINSNKEAGVNVTYSKLTNEFTFTAKETGTAGKVEFSKDGLAGKLFGGATQETEGQDAIFTATIDGKEMELTRSSNVVDFDGLSVTLKGTFGYKTDANGNILHEQKADDKGLLFSDESIRGKQSGDAISIVSASGKAYTYQPADTSDPLFGQKVYGKLDANGATKFFIKSKDGEEETEVYLRKTESGGTWFSDSNENAVSVKAQMNEEAVRDTSAEAITFTSSSDSDKIVEAVKSFVNDYNEMVTQIKNAYSTLPVQKSSGAYYEPLTDDERADLSESAIEAWEEKAKTGILFGDRDLSSLYSRLTSAVSMYGQDGADLKAAGITVSYSNGLSTLSFDENTLRDTLNSDPDRVRDIFTKNKDNGAATNGLVAAIKEPLEVFGGTSGAVKGTLVEKAGSPLAPTSIYQNYIQKQLDNLDTQIEKWQNKMSDQVDYYTTQFSKLEQLIAQMNSQSSALSQMMGGY